MDHIFKEYNILNAKLFIEEANVIISNVQFTYISNVEDELRYLVFDEYGEFNVYLEKKLKAGYCSCNTFRKMSECAHSLAIIILNYRDEPPKAKIDDKAQIYTYPFLAEWTIFNKFDRTDVKKIKSLKTIITEENKNGITGIISEGKNTYTAKVSQSETNITAYCNCGKTKTLCYHSASLLLIIITKYGDPYYIYNLRDTTAEQIELLKEYGLKPIDAESELFGFEFNKNKLVIKPPKNLIQMDNWDILKNLDLKNNNKNKIHFEIPKEYLIVLKESQTTPRIKIDVVALATDANKKLEKREEFKSFEEIQRKIPTLSNLIYNCTSEGIYEYLIKINPSYRYYRYDSGLRTLSITEENKLNDRIVSEFLNHIGILAITNNIYLGPSKGQLSLKNIKPIVFSNDFIEPAFNITEKGQMIFLSILICINGELFEPELFENLNDTIFIKDGNAYLIKKTEYRAIFKDFKSNKTKLTSNSEKASLIKNFINPLKSKLHFNIPEDFIPPEKIAEKIDFAISLKEMEPNYLIFQPIVLYDGHQVELDNEPIEILEDNKNIIFSRDFAKEDKLSEILKTAHPNFASQGNQGFYFLTFNEAIKNNWFFETIKKLSEQNIAIFGQKNLTKFKYNSNKPKLNITGGSGIDWFDLHIELSYGEQIVPLKMLRQAIINKNDYIQLGDGTLGILPEEWIKKFRSMFQLSSIKNENELQVSKFHYTLVDELHEHIDQAEILKELQTKKEQLQNIDKLKILPLPKNIKAKLRPYQESGYQWFNQLYQIGWGGCLADDMGLGKTLQTLCFLQNLINKSKKTKALIVCPTSLIYNWESEILKFTTGINHVIYHGSDRDLGIIKSKDWHILITSYGTLRNDIEDFQKVNFEVTILDESQSIKNPISQVTKAVQLIKTKQKFILSGTPVQNNTFDLYSQLNFVNPGLLGNQEFFKSEFAIPIDKNGDKEKSDQLRKMVFPFILRRTKEQVAKDLPAKTETIMYCEMGSYQQKVYNAVKEDYRMQILGKIESVGLAKSTFAILEGLNKLRQICDCPSLVSNEDGKRFKQESIKLDEISREIVENISDHKILVFSQFLGMLDLIKQKLEAAGISFLYLDGSTPAKDRAELVNKFQNDKSVQVFLISLKAGGVGLNLTAADYVYIVDPWWNPAVEDQAIDRTHRIGQSKKIFSYKLICKNSIEEKIIQLQSKKKSLAKELISEDASFVKKLTKEDVAWLLN